MFRKPKITSTKTTLSNVNSFDENTTNNSIDSNLSTNFNPEFTPDYDSVTDNMVISIAGNTSQIERRNTTLQNGNTKVGLLIDSVSVCAILSKSLAIDVINYSSLARWLTRAPSKDVKTFANEPIPVIGMMQTHVESNGWRIEDAEFVVIRDCLIPLIGRDLIAPLSISVTQALNSVSTIKLALDSEVLNKSIHKNKY